MINKTAIASALATARSETLTEYVEAYKQITEVFPYHTVHQHIGHHVQQYKRPTPKVGRNKPCPCGSGSKYKKCCETTPKHK